MKCYHNKTIRSKFEKIHKQASRKHPEVFRGALWHVTVDGLTYTSSDVRRLMNAAANSKPKDGYYARGRTRKIGIWEVNDLTGRSRRSSPWPFGIGVDSSSPETMETTGKTLCRGHSFRAYSQKKDGRNRMSLVLWNPRTQRISVFAR
jgi:hypothetical protein